ncbi:MAG: MlaD family protein [Desulfovibrio sp.]|jgi:paraquat-inducible protein B|nr:MCE family protein [Desulfovibrio sp.]MBQ1539798.1 MCE family protein [Desulfovibrio sp.]MBQ2476620.1 MCE family protein [Desulfovibrio sp.]MCR5170285.1 MlaD family protein [Desulfovibrio sp.]
MSLSSHKTAVGFFSIAGVALLVFGLVALGGGRFWKTESEYVLYFGSSVSGLSIGAPVVFRGVPLGSVTHISLVANSTKSNVTIPVNITINAKNLILATGSSLKSEMEEADVIRDMVAKGMRGRLQLSSLITGQYRVELDFFPDTPAEFKSSTPEFEIPTIMSPMDTLTKTFQHIPVQKIVNQMDKVLSRLANLAERGDLERAVKGCADMFESANALLEALHDLQAPLKGILANTEKASSTMPGAVESVSTGLADLPKTLASCREAMAALSQASSQFGRASASVHATMNPDAPVFQEMQRTLREAREALHSVRDLSTAVERRPESLIRGRKGAY